MIVGPSKCLKQIILIKNYGDKNPDWQEANQLAIYWSVVEDLNFQLVFRAGGDQHWAFNLLQVHRSNLSVTPLAPLVKIKAFFSYNEARLEHL